MKTDFPKRIFVRSEKDGADRYFLASESLAEAMDSVPAGQKEEVAEYELVSAKKFKTEVVEA